MLTASTVTLTDTVSVTLPFTGTGQTDSPLAEPTVSKNRSVSSSTSVEEETDRFLETVAKTLWGLLCVLTVLDNVVI